LLCAVVNLCVVMNLQVPYNAGNFTSGGTMLSRRTVFHGVQDGFTAMSHID